MLETVVQLNGYRLIKISHYRIMVGLERLELSHLTALEPKSSASTNSATAPFRYSIITSA